MIDNKLKLYNALDRCNALSHRLKLGCGSKSYVNVLLYGLRRCLDLDKLLDTYYDLDIRWAYRKHKTKLFLASSGRLQYFV